MSYTSEVLADTPTLYYRLNDGTTTIVDGSGNGNGGVATAGVTLGVAGAIATDPTDNAVSFNGTTGDINVPNNVWSGVLPVSVEFWCKPTATNPVGIFDSGPGQVTVLRNFNNGQIDWQGVNTVNLPALSTSVWTHVVLVFKLIAGNRSLLIYINGVLSSTTTMGAGGGGYNGTTNWKLGTINNGGNGWYAGALDEFAVYSGIELSAARVLVHYNAAFPFSAIAVTGKGIVTIKTTIIPKGQLAISGPRPKDATLPYIGHLYDNKGKFKRTLDPLLNRPMLKQTLNGGFQPVTLDMPFPIRQYADVVTGEAPGAYFKLDDATGSVTDVIGGPSLAATVLDRTPGMSFGNDPALSAIEGTTSLKQSQAVPTSGYLFAGNALWDDSQPTNWSVEFMFKTAGQSNRFHPMFHHLGSADASDVLQIYIGPQGNAASTTYGTLLQFFVRSPAAGQFFFSNTAFTPTPNVWHHLVLVNANGTYTLYVDGVNVYSAASGIAVPRLNRGFVVCAHPGSMQELAIYGTNLSSGTVTAHNTARSAGSYKSTITGDSPLGYWRLGDQIGSLIAEPAVSDLRLQLKAPIYTQAPLINDDKSVQFASKPGGDELLTAAGGGWFSAAAPKPITGTKFSIEVWLKPGTLQKDRVAIGGEAYIGGRTIAMAGDVVTNTGYVVLTQNGPDVHIGYPSNRVIIANVLTTGKHHLVWTHDSAAGTPDTLYVDGKVVGTGNLAAPAPPAGLSIGFNPNGQDSYFGGQIDEVAFWNIVMPQSQVQRHYKAGTDMTQGDLITLTEQGGDGTVLYKGIVEDIPDDYDLAPSFQIGVQPMVVELADAFFSKNYNVPTDIAQMVQDAVDATGHLTWNTLSIPTTGILAQMDFTDSTALQVLENCKKIGGPYFWWFVDQNGLAWFQQFDLTVKALWSTKMGVDHNARRWRSPIGNLKNKVLVVGNIPPNATVPITSLYSDLASQAQYGLRALWPPLTYPNIIDQPTLDKVAQTVGTELNRRVTKIELELPAFALILLGVNGGPTMRYWEPNNNPLLEAEFGSGRYSPNYVILDVEQDGAWQKVVLGTVPISSDDLKYEGDRQQQRDFLQQLLHPDLSSTVPTSMSGGFFSAAIGTLPQLPTGFTGFSLDAANGLSLYNNGVLIGRFGSGGASGVLQAFSGYQPVDSTHKAILRYEYTPDVQSFSKVFLSFSLKAFRATIQGTSGASSASSSSSQAHNHTITLKHGVAADETPGYKWSIDRFTTSDTADRVSLTETDGSHSHTIAHTHAITAPDGLYDTGMAQGVHVYVDGTDRTTALGGPWGVGSALDVSDLDISQWITTTGWHEIMLSSTTLGVILAQISSKVYTKTV